MFETKCKEEKLIDRKEMSSLAVAWTSVQFNQWIITTGVITYVTASLSRRCQIAFSCLPVPYLLLQIAFGNTQHVVVLLLVFRFRCFQFCFAGFTVMCLVVTFLFPPVHLFCIWGCVSPLFFVSLSVFCLVLVCLCLLLMCRVFSSFCPLPLSGLLLVLYSVLFVFLSWILFYLTFGCQSFFLSSAFYLSTNLFLGLFGCFVCKAHLLFLNLPTTVCAFGFSPFFYPNNSNFSIWTFSPNTCYVISAIKGKSKQRT